MVVGNMAMEVDHHDCVPVPDVTNGDVSEDVGHEGTGDRSFLLVPPVHKSMPPRKLEFVG